jgi:thioredoxin-related protein
LNKIVYIFLFSVVSLFGLEYHSYEEALKIQKTNHKIIMLDVVRTGCHYCEDMDDNVFKNEEMSKWIEKRFIPVQLNLDFDELPLGLKVHFTPTFFFINGKNEVLKIIPGSWNIEDFKDLIKDIK